MNESAHDTSADHATISATTQQWVDAFNNGDAAAIASMMSTDGQLFPPNGDMVAGREAIQTFWQGFIDMGVKGSLEVLEINVAGDMAFKTGTFQMLDPEGNEIDHGKFLEVWQRIDSTWSFHRDMWNSSIPVPEEG